MQKKLAGLLTRSEQIVALELINSKVVEGFINMSWRRSLINMRKPTTKDTVRCFIAAGLLELLITIISLAEGTFRLDGRFILCFYILIIPIAWVVLADMVEDFENFFKD